MTVVIDASVALKWFVEEQGTEQAAALLAGQDLLIAPDLIVAEVANAGWKPFVRAPCCPNSMTMPQPACRLPSTA